MPSVTCKSCATPFSGEYCPNCGQRIITRFTAAYMWQQFHGEFLEVDRGLWRTAKDLTTRPGHMIREYLDGKTRYYYSPLKYLLVWVGLFVLLAAISARFGVDVAPNFDDSFKVPKNLENSVLAGTYFQFIRLVFANLSLYFFLVIPFLAIAMRLLFRQLSVVEHCMVLAFLWGQSMLAIIPLSIVLITISLLLDSLAIATVALVFLPVLLLIGYFSITYKQLTGGRYLRTLLRLLVAIYLGYISFTIVAMGVLLAYKIV